MQVPRNVYNLRFRGEASCTSRASACYSSVMDCPNATDIRRVQLAVTRLIWIQTRLTPHALVYENHIRPSGRYHQVSQQHHTTMRAQAHPWNVLNHSQMMVCELVSTTMAERALPAWHASSGSEDRKSANNASSAPACTSLTETPEVPVDAQCSARTSDSFDIHVAVEINLGRDGDCCGGKTVGGMVCVLLAREASLCCPACLCTLLMLCNA